MSVVTNNTALTESHFRQLSSKFKVPITFVFAVKGKGTHYNLCATTPVSDYNSPEEIAESYVKKLEEMVISHPTQWFNFYDYYAS